MAGEALIKLESLVFFFLSTSRTSPSVSLWAPRSFAKGFGYWGLELLHLFHRLFLKRKKKKTLVFPSGKKRRQKARQPVFFLFRGESLVFLPLDATNIFFFFFSLIRRSMGWYTRCPGRGPGKGNPTLDLLGRQQQKQPFPLRGSFAGGFKSGPFPTFIL